jgi:hypothetical protein
MWCFGLLLLRLRYGFEEIRPAASYEGVEYSVGQEFDERDMTLISHLIVLIGRPPPHLFENSQHYKKYFNVRDGSPLFV